MNHDPTCSGRLDIPPLHHFISALLLRANSFLYGLLTRTHQQTGKHLPQSLSRSEFGITINIIIIAAVVVDDETFTELI